MKKALIVTVVFLGCTTLFGQTKIETSSNTDLTSYPAQIAAKNKQLESSATLSRSGYATLIQEKKDLLNAYKEQLNKEISTTSDSKQLEILHSELKKVEAELITLTTNR